MKKLVYIASPYRGDIETNTKRAERYCYYAYCRGHIPIAPHLHNTRFLDDSILSERDAGMELGLSLLEHCDEVWAFGRFPSEGMKNELRYAGELGKPIKRFTTSIDPLEERGETDADIANPESSN